MICKNCKFWEKSKTSEDNLGDCLKLSAKKTEEYPDVEYTGIESTPFSYHDGIGVYYETKDWFGCIHFYEKNK